MTKSLYGERDYAYGQRMLTLRTALGLTQAGLAAELGVSRRAVAQWEGGLGYPNVDHLKGVITLAVLKQVFAPGREAEDIREFWKAARQKVWLDEQWLATLLNLHTPSLALFPTEQSQSADLVSGDPSDEIALWMVPYARNPHFTGRDDLLAHVEQQFSSQEPDQPTTLRQTALTQSQAIKGLGGIGKTQIAVEYAYRAREQGRYRHTIWVIA
ncbi:MAG TPA: helix-turn-helix transcriptional regulator, partial [Ktedonobacteraceae bacterium]|nr:helix-turn-helix transcriptional regulator [Ktedonobacteraceae bacterium]